MSGRIRLCGADSVFIWRLFSSGCKFACAYFHQAVNSHAFIFRCALADDAHIALSEEHSEFRWFDLDELSAVQRIRVEDCLQFDGKVQSRSF